MTTRNTCDSRPDFDGRLLDTVRSGRGWASIKIAAEMKASHKSVQNGLRRLKRRGLVVHDGVWRADGL